MKHRCRLLQLLLLHGFLWMAVMLIWPNAAPTFSVLVKKIARNNSSSSPSRDVFAAYRRKSSVTCIQFKGRLGNQMFQFASAFGIARAQNRTVVIARNDTINKIFHFKGKVKNIENGCKGMKRKFANLAAGFDSGLMNLSVDDDFEIGKYLQSWRYFHHVELEIRRQFTFREEVKAKANAILRDIKLKYPYPKQTVLTYIGVHIRRGDMQGAENRKLGYSLATERYMQKAVQFVLSRYHNVVFIVATDDLTWSKYVMTRNPNTKVYFTEGDNAEEDMVTLASCNHTIMTVGSFGWWIAWLAGGTTIYFKWPAVSGSDLWKEYKFDDYYYPNWVGLD